MKAIINGQNFGFADKTLTVSKSVGIYECSFVFDSSWDGWNKTAVFEGSGQTIEVVISDNKAQIPWEVLKESGWLKIGVYGTLDEKVKPTIWGEKLFVKIGTPTGSIGTEPTPSIYAQILEVANEAKDIAEEVQTEWESVTATAETLPSDASATASFDGEVFTFGIPQGQQGEQGEQGEKGEQGATPSITVTPITGGHRITISIESGGTGNIQIFDVMDGKNGQRGADGVGITDIELTSDYCLKITLSNGTMIITSSIRGEKGEKGDKGDKGDRGERGIQGETGNGIESITKTATVGKVDTYTITYTDGTTTTFDVTNGEVTEADLEEALYDKADVIENTASGTIASFSDGSAMPVKSLEVEINAVQSGSGDPSPTNIRPISGWDSVNVVRTGKNLYDDSTLIHGYFNTQSTNIIADESYRVISLNLKAGTYTVSLMWSETARLLRYYADGVITGASRNTNTITVTTTTDGLFMLCFRRQDSATITEDIKAQVELGSTATAYEPYNGTTYPITLPNTCYGGKIKDGVLTVTHGYILFDGTQSASDFVFSANPQGIQNNRITWVSYVNLGKIGSKSFMSDKLAITNLYTSAPGEWVVSNSGSTVARCYIGVPNTITSTADWLAYCTDNPIQLVYELATPTEIPITEIDMSTVYGVNNIWGDCGDVAVIYRADTKAYIDGTIVDVPLAMIAPIENGTTSSKAYAVGEYFILNGNQFCKAKTAIASGATFTLNTNYTVTTIGAELKALQ